MQQELYTTSESYGECDCPIHADGRPPVAPLGLHFEDRIDIREIARETAGAIYDAHHSYMPSVPDVNIVHHGIYYQGHLMGALSYRTPLIGRLKLGVHQNGGLTRNYENAVGTFMVNGRELVEVNRICIGVPMKNLASCGLAHSMDKFLTDMEEDRDWRWLLTFIRNDHVGSMLKALNDKGWQLVGYSEPRAPGNRPTEDIHSWKKQRWIFPMYDYTERIEESAPSPTVAPAVADD